QRYDLLLDAALAELRRGYGDRLVAVAVFGSVGRATPRDDSDVDLLIVARDLPEGRMRRVEQFLPMEARLERALQSIQGDGARSCSLPSSRRPRRSSGAVPSSSTWCRCSTRMSSSLLNRNV